MTQRLNLRFRAMISEYVLDEANGLILQGRVVEEMEITSNKMEAYVGWRVKIRYAWDEQPSLLNQLAKANVKVHYVSLEQLMGLAWATR